MIKLTEKSSQQIIKLLKTEAPLAKLRMRVVGGGCSGLSYKLEFDANTPAANDKIYEDFGISIIVDSKSDFYLSGTTLDFDDGLNGQGFIFHNPKSKRSCGCGSSFSI
jgi:iron-sulfur cluster assembly protein